VVLEEAEKVTIRAVEWFPEARELIGRAEPGRADSLNWIEAEIKAGRLTLFSVRDPWELIGVFTARWYLRYDGIRVLTIIHGVATKKETGFSFMWALKNPIKQIAKDCGCGAIEIHTRRKGMDRRLTLEGGYQFQESIFSLEV